MLTGVEGIPKTIEEGLWGTNGLADWLMIRPDQALESYDKERVLKTAPSLQSLTETLFYFFSREARLDGLQLTVLRNTSQLMFSTNNLIIPTFYSAAETMGESVISYLHELPASSGAVTVLDEVLKLKDPGGKVTCMLAFYWACATVAANGQKLDYGGSFSMTYRSLLEMVAVFENDRVMARELQGVIHSGPFALELEMILRDSLPSSQLLTLIRERYNFQVVTASIKESGDRIPYYVVIPRTESAVKALGQLAGTDKLIAKPDQFSLGQWAGGCVGETILAVPIGSDNYRWILGADGAIKGMTNEPISSVDTLDGAILKAAAQRGRLLLS
ncbi:MAG: hypothetical protein UW86_C0005G0024 [Microgenomates group bacterium GW2011_GWA1_Microgenomates_45_10]|nr:MAG: hypothetical protein UW73_C0016G0024 [Microgenomates group bacterium GW2011_GWB1_44_8]KKT87283.1 MAG: hypothetical protein UW86_C0005G0024 [Microgenomates group bacterium GW2011_GWA1_Microgenomates_45_10]